MDEKWRLIPGYPHYRVSSTGRVMSYKRPWKPLELRGGYGPYGHRSVQLFNEGTGKTFCVHALVARAFLGPRPEGLEVRHLDGNAKNNDVSNLAYGTPSENRYDMVAHNVHWASRKTHCAKGHPFSAENTYIAPSQPTWRSCRTCSRDKSREAARKRRALARLRRATGGAAA